MAYDENEEKVDEETLAETTDEDEDEDLLAEVEETEERDWM